MEVICGNSVQKWKEISEVRILHVATVREQIVRYGN